MQRFLSAVLLAACLLLPALAHAQFVYTPTPPSNLQPLDGATVAGKIHIQLAQTTGAPWVFSFDGVTKNTENGAPYVLASVSGSADDLNLFDTGQFADGLHVVSAKGAAQTITASFTIANKAPPPVIVPAPPSPPTVTGNATLTWIAPTTNVDNSALTDLAGFRIYLGVAAETLDRMIVVADPAARTFTVPALTPGTWYFALTAYTKTGAESIDSSVVSQVIAGDPVTPPPPPPPPSCTAPQPPNDTQTMACPSGSQGSWTQTRGYLSTAYPQCWTAGAWLPASPPAGACLTWTVAKNGTSVTRPVYEAVLPLTGAALVRGNQEGAAKVGAPCGAEVFAQATNSYRAIADADAGLASPTYRGRQHVALCTHP